MALINNNLTFYCLYKNIPMFSDLVKLFLMKVQDQCLDCEISDVFAIFANISTKLIFP